MFLNLKIEWVEFCNLSRAPEEIPHQKLKVTPACAPEVGSQIRLRLVCVGTKGDWVYLRKVAWLIFIYFFFNQPTWKSHPKFRASSPKRVLPILLPIIMKWKMGPSKVSFPLFEGDFQLTWLWEKGYHQPFTNLRHFISIVVSTALQSVIFAMPKIGKTCPILQPGEEPLAATEAPPHSIQNVSPCLEFQACNRIPFYLIAYSVSILAGGSTWHHQGW